MKVKKEKRLTEQAKTEMRSVSRRKSERRKKNYNPDLSGVEVAGDIDLSPLPMILRESGQINNLESTWGKSR